MPMQIIIPERELWDEQNQLFIITKKQILSLEHSLVSISKWESKWHKPFISDKEKTIEETIDYIRCMTITQNVDYTIYNYITNEILDEIHSYIGNPMTATWFNEDKNAPKKKSSEQITSELIYYWMVVAEIPFKCETWHLNRLFTLIRVCNVKSQKPKKMSKRDVLSRNSALNASRRKNLNTSG